VTELVLFAVGLLLGAALMLVTCRHAASRAVTVDLGPLQQLIREVLAVSNACRLDVDSLRAELEPVSGALAEVQQHHREERQQLHQRVDALRSAIAAASSPMPLGVR